MLYIRGYLKIRITGDSPERFLNLCKNKNIKIWGLESKNHVYVMCMKVSDFRKIKTILRKTKTKVMIEERIGLPFFFYKYRKRFYFFIGILLCTLLVYIGTFFIWNIEFNGNQYVTKEVLLSYLKTQNVYHGMLKSNVKCEKIAKNIRKDFGDIVWVSVSVKGTHLTIHMKENDDYKINKDYQEQVYNIVADKKGKVHSIVTRNGIPVVKVGSEIKEGDILISGVIDIHNDAKEIIETHYVAADADIIIETKDVYQEIVKKEYKEKKYKKKKTIPFIRIGEALFDFGFQKINYDIYEIKTVENQLQIGELKLPIWHGRQYVKEYEWIEKEYTEKEMERLLNKAFNQYCDKIEENKGSIIKHELFYENLYDGMKLSGELILLQECGVRMKIIDF